MNSVGGRLEDNSTVANSDKIGTATTIEDGGITARIKRVSQEHLVPSSQLLFPFACFSSSCLSMPAWFILLFWPLLLHATPANNTTTAATNMAAAVI